MKPKTLILRTAGTNCDAETAYAFERAGATKCIWHECIGDIELPIAHGAGRFVPADDAVRQSLWDNDHVALVYAGVNPNGSVDAIAGICDSTGLIFGLMPHPERHVDAQQ